jgi:hypothetical protein
MRARIYAQLPYKLTVPEGVEFTSDSYQLQGYMVVDVLPTNADFVMAPGEQAALITVNGSKAHETDLLVVDFYKEEFSRRQGDAVDKEKAVFDPPKEIINEALNNLLRRIRYVGRGFRIQPIKFPECGGAIVYTDDDGNQLPEQQGLVRQIHSRNFSFTLNIVTPEAWSNAQSLPPDFQPPTWDDIRLDAENSLPHIGTAIVLSAVALETFISQIVEALGSKNTKPPGLWTYVTNREDWYQLPSVTDNFDSMLKLFTNHSLKDEPRLWEAFKNIKTARNEFVHRGIARISEDGPALTLQATEKLVGKMNEIIDKVRTWLPVEMQWPTFVYKNQVDIRSSFWRRKITETPKAEQSPKGDKTEGDQ